MAERNNLSKWNKWVLIFLIFISFVMTAYNRSLDQQVTAGNTLTNNDALEIVKAKYVQAQNIYQIRESFSLSKEVTKINDANFKEILNYEKVVTGIFTKKGQDQFEQHYNGIIVKKDNKVYLSNDSYKADTEYVGTTFVVESINKNELKCIAKSKYVDSQTGSVLKNSEDTFTLLNNDSNWLIDQVVIPN